MTYTATNNVPRESYHVRIKRRLAQLAKAIWGARNLSPQEKRHVIPNDRMVELNPHLLRDIGFTDINVPRKYH